MDDLKIVWVVINGVGLLLEPTSLSVSPSSILACAGDFSGRPMAEVVYA